MAGVRPRIDELSRGGKNNRVPLLTGVHHVAVPTTDLTASLSTRALRLTLRTLPRRLVEGPIYKSAMARAARVG